MAGKVVYENIAIGVIAQRIGECRYANRYLMNLRMAITQQITKPGMGYRDTVITINDEILVIEFKHRESSNAKSIVQ